MWPSVTFWKIGFWFSLIKALRCSLQNKSSIIWQIRTVPPSATLIIYWHWRLQNQKVVVLYCDSIKASDYNLYFWSMQHLTKHWYVKGKVRWCSRFVIFYSSKEYICLFGDFSRSRYPPLSGNVKLWFRASFCKLVLCTTGPHSEPVL